MLLLVFNIDDRRRFETSVHSHGEVVGEFRRLNRGTHQDDFRGAFSVAQELADDQQEKIGIFVAFVHFVDYDMRVVGQ